MLLFIDFLFTFVFKLFSWNLNVYNNKLYNIYSWNELKFRKTLKINKIMQYYIFILNSPSSSGLYTAQTTQTTYLLSQGGLRRPLVDPARYATFLR